MAGVARRCGFCESSVAPFESPRLLGLPFVHRYRCACSARFEILTRFGEIALVMLNATVVAAIALLPISKFKSESDRSYILAFLLLIQVPIVGILVWRSARNARRHTLVE